MSDKLDQYMEEKVWTSPALSDRLSWNDLPTLAEWIGDNNG